MPQSVRLSITFILIFSLILLFAHVVISQNGTRQPPPIPPPNQINYQGYLTDNQGSPLNGDYALDFTLYNAPSAGEAVWGPENHAAVSVERGLFNTVLGQTIELTPNLFRQALYLEVTVNQTNTLPLQPLRPVPQAFSLLPGATIEGQPIGSTYGLTVINTSADRLARGMLAVGEQHGLVVQETGAGDVALKSTSFVEAQGYKSVEPTYWWVAGIQGVPQTPLVAQPTLTGTAILSSVLTGTHQFYLPLSIPSQLYGQPVSVRTVRLNYQTSDPQSYIRRVQLVKQVDVAQVESLLDESLQLDSQFATSLTLTTTGHITLTADSGPLNLALTVDLAAPTHTISIGGARLRLDHTD